MVDEANPCCQTGSETPLSPESINLWNWESLRFPAFSRESFDHPVHPFLGCLVYLGMVVYTLYYINRFASSTKPLTQTPNPNNQPNRRKVN